MRGPPLVQEFVPASKRGMVGGLVTAAVPIGVLLGAALGAYATPYVGWRGLFAIGMVPGLLTLLIRAWVPESPRWLIQMGRIDEARKSLAWALEMDPAGLTIDAARRRVRGSPCPGSRTSSGTRGAWPSPGSRIWGRRRAITGSLSGFLRLLVQLLGVTPARASFLLIFVNFAACFGRIGLSYLSDAIGRKGSGAIASFGAAILMVTAALYHNAFLGTVSVFWLLLIVNNAFADGGFAIVGPYSAEVWPVALRTTGMGSAYGFGGLGKVIGPLGLALIVGSSNLITPKASVAALLPSFSYLAAWFALAGFAYIFIGKETKGRSLEAIEQELDAPRPAEIVRAKIEQDR